MVVFPPAAVLRVRLSKHRGGTVSSSCFMFVHGSRLIIPLKSTNYGSLLVLKRLMVFVVGPDQICWVSCIFNFGATPQDFFYPKPIDR